MTTRAIGYVRVSSLAQAKDDRDGLPRQRDAIRAYCAGKKLALVEEHEDAGVSGTVPLVGREGLSRALERCGELGATILVVERADRLGRDLIVSEMAVRAFAEAGVSIVTADTGENITEAGSDPSRKLIRQVLSAVAEYERSALVSKLRAARDRKRRGGGHSVGCYPFGQHPGQPEEATTLARIHELCRTLKNHKRLSCRVIATILNSEGRPSRSGRPWTHAMVGHTLRS